MTPNFVLLQDASASGGGMMNLMMIVLLIVVFYFFMIRPQQKKQKEIKKFREALGNGDRVITAGGIHGEIVSVKDTYFVLEIAPAVRIRIDKGSVYPYTDAGQEQPLSR